MQKVFEAIQRLREELKGTGFRLHDFGGDVTMMPIPKQDGWSQSSLIIIEPDQENAHDN